MQQKDYYSIKELCDSIGISRKLAYQSIKDGELKAVRVGKKLYRIPHSEYIKFVGLDEPKIGSV